MLTPEAGIQPVAASNGGDVTVAAWERTTGAPLQAAVRDGTGTWTSPHDISGRDARDPQASVTADGTVAVIFQGFDDSNRRVVQVATRDPAGAWSSATTLSDRAKDAVEPHLAAAGTALSAIWVRTIDRDTAVVDVADRTAVGGWTAPQTISAVGQPRHARIALAPDGDAVAVWADARDSTVMAASRQSGSWTQPVVISDRSGRSAQPSVTSGVVGTAVAIWTSRRPGPDPATIETAEYRREGWGTPAILDRGPDAARNLTRPGRADNSPTITVTGDGRVGASWTLFDGTSNAARAAVRDAEGRWTPPIPLSARANWAAGAVVATRAGQAPIAAWEEIDGGLLRVRARVLSPLGGCFDLTRPTGERADVRLAGGVAATGVFVDLNRRSIVAVRVP